MRCLWLCLLLLWGLHPWLCICLYPAVCQACSPACAKQIRRFVGKILHPSRLSWLTPLAVVLSCPSPLPPPPSCLSPVQNRAVVNLFKGPNAIEGIATTVDRLATGDLKLRVRALEAERALTRVAAWQKVVASALAASTLVNVGTVLSVSAMGTAATASFVGAGVFGFMMLSNYLKVVKLEKKELQLSGAV